MTAPAVDDIKPGGLGVSFIYQAFDDVEFCAGEEAGNRVTMRLHEPTKDARLRKSARPNTPEGSTGEKRKKNP